MLKQASKQAGSQKQTAGAGAAAAAESFD